MIETIVTFLEHTLIPLGVIGIFVAATIEAVIAPIPSALVLYSSGFLFLSNLSGLSFLWGLFFIVAIPAAIGATLGSYVIYYLGYFLGKPFFDKFGRLVGVSWDDIERMRMRFAKGPRDEVTLTVLRAIPIIPATALTALAGVLRMHPISYGIATFIGSIIRGAILASIGGKMGLFYKEHVVFINTWENVILMILGGVVIVVFGYFIFEKRKKGRDIISS